MRRLLFVLPTAVLVAGIAFAVAFYFLDAFDVSPRTVATAELDQDSGPVEMQADAPLETFDRRVPEPAQQAPHQPEPTVGPQPAAAEQPGTPKPTTLDPELEVYGKELYKELEAANLTDEERVARNAEIKKALEEIAARPKNCQVTLNGRVLDHAGQPLADATVTGASMAHGENGPRAVGVRDIATTDADGNFEGTYAALVSTNTGFEIEVFARSSIAPESEHLKLTVTPGESYTDLVINMPQGGGVTGRVVDSNFSPITGATVLASITGTRDSSGRARRTGVPTDVDGLFTVQGLTPGSYTVSVTCAGYTPPDAWPTVMIAAGDPAALAADIVMATQTSVKVTFTSAGRPLSGNVKADFYSADGKLTKFAAGAGSDGKVLIGPIPENVTEVEFGKHGYRKTARIAISPVAGAHLDLGEITLEVDPDAKVK